jgi:hypothetical protein
MIEKTETKRFRLLKARSTGTVGGDGKGGDREGCGMSKSIDNPSTLETSFITSFPASISFVVYTNRKREGFCVK